MSLIFSYFSRSMTLKTRLKLFASFFSFLISLVGIYGFFSWTVVGAEDVDFAIIPQSEVSESQVINDVKDLANSPGHVWDRYKELSQDKNRSL